ncbi:MAG TPA: (d)CMP kinase [Candidatus Choladousia intestinavium]|uniref:Cytidylate kinase n=1 Tax=Candidatus Choladousia intestinavium TaxID=2840727 RepID=A0A9D1D8N5_9FIRM|nr:(d)CMP kinase [Candidatus Choladousia intestinavium]
MSFNIAIDGPAGAGKSTIARKAASRLSFLYVDTGAMYRAIALGLLERKTDLRDSEMLKEALEEISVTIGYDSQGRQQVFLNGEDVSSRIRDEEVGKMASASSALAQVREKLTALQRGLAKKENVLMDGRDIGTVILPGAQLKIYLTAGVEVRARRRHQELTAKNIPCSLEEIEKDIRERDERDRNRPVAPLKQAEDAVRIDTSDMTIEEVTDRIVELARKRMGEERA